MEDKVITYRHKIEKFLASSQIASSRTSGFLGLEQFDLVDIRAEQRAKIDKIRAKPFCFALTTMPRLDFKAQVFYLTPQEEFHLVEILRHLYYDVYGHHTNGYKLLYLDDAGMTIDEPVGKVSSDGKIHEHVAIYPLVDGEYVYMDDNLGSMLSYDPSEIIGYRYVAKRGVSQIVLDKLPFDIQDELVSYKGHFLLPLSVKVDFLGEVEDLFPILDNEIQGKRDAGNTVFFSTEYFPDKMKILSQLAESWNLKITELNSGVLVTSDETFGCTLHSWLSRCIVNVMANSTPEVIMNVQIPQTTENYHKLVFIVMAAYRAIVAKNQLLLDEVSRIRVYSDMTVIVPVYSKVDYLEFSRAVALFVSVLDDIKITERKRKGAWPVSGQYVYYPKLKSLSFPKSTVLPPDDKSKFQRYIAMN